MNPMYIYIYIYIWFSFPRVYVYVILALRTIVNTSEALCKQILCIHVSAKSLNRRMLGSNYGCSFLFRFHDSWDRVQALLSFAFYDSLCLGASARCGGRLFRRGVFE